MKLLTSLILGILFSIGLTVSGMVNPNKVIGFLDIFRNWDPALAFVMGGAVGINLIMFKFILKRKSPLLTANFSIPSSSSITWELLTGSAMFGIGWGLTGICPGPGLANLFTLNPKILTFVGFMILGMFLYKVFENILKKE
ncbi:MAG: putative membrane protein YedE/YeeE [Bacteriovoracaceae bacterium]|jgi:uncharacterized membrane protein YedE/YeeE